MHHFIMKQFPLLLCCAAIAILSGCEKSTGSNSGPAIRLTSPDPVTVSHEGETITISYEIENPADGGEISAAASAGWISSPEYASAEEIRFTVEPNTEPEERTATITVTYTYDNGKTVEATAGIKQDPGTTETEVPQIRMQATEVTVPSEGKKVELSYEIINPAEDGRLTATAQCEWISSLSTDESNVSFRVAENYDKTKRSEKVIVKYSYGNQKYVEVEITVTQEEAIISEYRYEVEATALDGYYFGATGKNGEHQYAMTVSDKGYDGNGNFCPGGSYYILYIFCNEPEDSGNPKPTPGEYKLGGNGLTNPMTVAYSFSFAIKLDDESQEVFNVKFAEGSYMNISYEGANTVIDAVLVDTNGNAHHLTYSGEASFKK